MHTQYEKDKNSCKLKRGNNPGKAAASRECGRLPPSVDSLFVELSNIEFTIIILSNTEVAVAIC